MADIDESSFPEGQTPAWARKPTPRSRIPRLFQPQMTFKYLVSSFAILYILYCFLLNTPLFSSNLPAYDGPYDVGTIDLETPCRQRRISNAIYKSTGEPALELNTVLFSLFYPSEKDLTSSAKHSWISKPISHTAEGYLRFGDLSNRVTNFIVTSALWLLIGSLKIPANVDVPLYGSTSSLNVIETDSQQGPPRFPVIVFSHGYASSRTDYTHYLGSLASQGYIVAAIEHRDGSSPASITMRNNSIPRTVYPLSASQIQSDPPMKPSQLKSTQLDFRQLEVEETVRVLRSINDGAGSSISRYNPRLEGYTLSDWTSRLDFSQLTMAGHSFGATLALQVLNPMAKPPFSPPSFTGCIALDPGKHSGPLNTAISVPLLVIHSSSWSRMHSIFHGRPHFSVVKDLVAGVLDSVSAAWFITSLGTSHPSVTDALLIAPLLLRWTTDATIDAKQGVEQYVNVTADFLRFLETGQKRGVLDVGVTHPEYDQEAEGRGTGGIPKDISRYWQVHLAPKSSDI